MEAAKARILSQTGVKPDCVLISSTHTHTAPSAVPALGTPEETAYGDSLVPKIADAMAMAVNGLAPAQVAHASGDCTGEVHNRRWRMTDG